MPVGLVLKLNDILVLRQLQQMGNAVNVFNTLNAIGNRLEEYVAQSFETRGRGKWPRLSWITEVTRKHGGDMPLQDSGDYKGSWQRESDGRTFVAVGSSKKAGDSNIPLAAIHEFGTGTHGAGRGAYVIQVKNARVLAARLNRPIGWLSTGKMSGTKKSPGWIIFGTRVLHPGVPERPVLPTFAQAEQMAKEVAEALLGGADVEEAGKDEGTDELGAV